MKTATLESVNFVITHPDAGPNAQHQQWMTKKTRDGWRHGLSKDGRRKTHPLLVPFDKLPEVERRKDQLIVAIVTSFLS
jgi:hypothetical protein